MLRILVGVNRVIFNIWSLEGLKPSFCSGYAKRVARCEFVIRGKQEFSHAGVTMAGVCGTICRTVRLAVPYLRYVIYAVGDMYRRREGLDTYMED